MLSIGTCKEHVVEQIQNENTEKRGKTKAQKLNKCEFSSIKLDVIITVVRSN